MLACLILSDEVINYDVGQDKGPKHKHITLHAAFFKNYFLFMLRRQKLCVSLLRLQLEICFLLQCN